ncbi:MAG: hypothetical protein GY756_19310 [bacterium]|nr:hypothetical protein [bacterium]
MSAENMFKRLDWKCDKLLICPSCLETLFRSDIEHFAKCPYCDHEIVFDSEIEDFLLKPVIDKWMTFQNIPLHDSTQVDI